MQQFEVDWESVAGRGTYIANFGLGCHLVITQIPNEIELYKPMVTEYIHSFIYFLIWTKTQFASQGTPD